MKLCSSCNKELADNAKFCSGCGSKQEPASSPTLSDDAASEPSLGFLSPNLLLSVAAIGIGILIYYSVAGNTKVNYAALVGRPASVLFQTNVIKSQIENRVGIHNVRNTVDFFSLAGPSGSLKVDGMYLVGSGCMQHNCANNEGLIFVNTQTNDVIIVLTEESPPRFTAYGMDYSAENKSFNKQIPPSAQRWLKRKNIRF